ncbi:MAG: ABC transporter ATP-binding protein [Egibacteraceae bacterium]
MDNTPLLPRVGASGRWRLLGLLVANGLSQAGAAVVAGMLVHQAFARLASAGGQDPRTLLRTATAFATMAFIGAWLRARERVDAERLGQDYTHELRLQLFERLTLMSPWAVQQRSQGGTMLRFVGDLNALRRWVSLGLARLLVAGTMMVGALIAISLLSVTLALITTALVAFGAVAVLVQGKGLRNATRKARRRRSSLAANVAEKIAAVGVVQAFGAVDRERRRVATQSKRLRRAMVTRARYAGRLQGVTEGTAAAATAGVVLTGLAGQASAATVVAAMTIVGLLANQLRDLGRVYEYRQQARVSRDAVRRFLERPTLLTEPAHPAPLWIGPGCLTFEDVRVGGVLYGISATAEPGQLVALVGPNGAGKTTLLAIAARLRDLDGGRVLLDWQDLAWHSAADVRRLIGVAGPDLPLLRGTVARNLRYRWPDAPEEELRRVAELCGLAEVLAELPNGEQSRIAEGGVGLSAGQRQRLMLARALLGEPAVLLLDEADANLDQEAMGVVDRVLAERRCTVLIATHHRRRVSGADQVWHLDGGRLVETGPPAALLRTCGPTARLFGYQVTS